MVATGQSAGVGASSQGAQAARLLAWGGSRRETAAKAPAGPVRWPTRSSPAASGDLHRVRPRPVRGTRGRLGGRCSPAAAEAGRDAVAGDAGGIAHCRLSQLAPLGRRPPRRGSPVALLKLLAVPTNRDLEGDWRFDLVRSRPGVPRVRRPRHQFRAKPLLLGKGHSFRLARQYPVPGQGAGGGTPP